MFFVYMFNEGLLLTKPLQIKTQRSSPSNNICDIKKDKLKFFKLNPFKIHKSLVYDVYDMIKNSNNYDITYSTQENLLTIINLDYITGEVNLKIQEVEPGILSIQQGEYLITPSFTNQELFLIKRTFYAYRDSIIREYISQRKERNTYNTYNNELLNKELSTYINIYKNSI